jgi:hypothetical protein
LQGGEAVVSVMHFKDDLQYKVLYSSVFGIKTHVSTFICSHWSSPP